MVNNLQKDLCLHVSQSRYWTFLNFEHELQCRKQQTGFNAGTQSHPRISSGPFERQEATSEFSQHIFTLGNNFRKR